MNLDGHLAVFLADHQWNEILDSGQRIGYVCGKCSKSIPGLIIIAKPDVAQRMREIGRLPRGAELVESPWLPDDNALAMDPRINEFGCTAR